MGCGGCGGASSIKVDRTPRSIPKHTPAPILRPASTRKLINSPKPVFKPSGTIVRARKRAAAVKICPVCGAPLTPVISGSGARKRKQCARCGQTFAM